MRRLLLICLALGCSDPAPPERAPLLVPDRPAPTTTPASASVSAPPSTSPSVAIAAGAAPESGIEDWVDAAKRAREERDRTLWRPEEEAQAHERFFIELWDQLRAEDPYAVLRRVQIHRIAPPRLDAELDLGSGVRRARQVGLEATLEPAGWLERLNAWEAAGYVIEATEWHHARFEPGPPARSDVKAELHLRKGEQRFVLRGLVKVTWRKRIPREVEFADVELIRRDAGAVFEELQRLPMGPNRPMPLLVHDLDGDARPEILVPWDNAKYGLVGGRYVRSAIAEGFPRQVEAATLADFTGEGDLDLLVAGQIGPQRVIALLVGDAGGQFKGPPQVVFAPSDPLENVRLLTPGDVDGDGDLDVWLAQYRGAYNRGRMPAPFHDANDGWPGYLLRNEGEGRFVDGTEAAGLAPLRRRHTQSATFFDGDGDGDVDLLTVNDFAGVDWHVNDGAGRFTRATHPTFDARALFGMAHAFGDFNQDGRLDLFATGMNSTTARRLEALGLNRPDHPEHPKWRAAMTFGNRLFYGTPDGFRQAPVAQQVAASGWSWGTVAFDLENDGDEEIFVANGFISGSSSADYCTQYWRHDVYIDNSMPAAAADVYLGERIRQVESGISWNGFEHNRLFVNQGDGFFEGGYVFGLGGEADARNVVATDLDADGRTDLLIAERPVGKDLRLRILRNVVETQNHWIGVRIAGQALGARIRVETEAGAHAALIAAGDSFLSQHPPTRVFGLGKRAAVKRIVVTWANGTERVLSAPAVDRWHQVRP